MLDDRALCLLSLTRNAASKLSSFLRGCSVKGASIVNPCGRFAVAVVLPFFQPDHPDAAERSQEKGLFRGDRESCLASRSGPFTSHQVQHPPGVVQKSLGRGAQQHHPAHGAGRHRRPRCYRGVSVRCGAGPVAGAGPLPSSIPGLMPGAAVTCLVFVG